MIARQMQPGLERLFKEFGKELGRPLPAPPSPLSQSADGLLAPEDNGAPLSRQSSRSSGNGHIKLPFNSPEYFEDDEDLMRRALETAVTTGIDLFRQVDKQQLSLLGATTDLTGPLVERLIERYVSAQVHETLLFPRLCDWRQIEDRELDQRIHQMEQVDVSQVGIAIEGGRPGKEQIIQRITKGVEEFRKMTTSGGPHEMLEVLLSTTKVLSTVPESEPGQNLPDNGQTNGEKPPSMLTINADVLVSLLLLVVIRSQVRHLQARLSYMQHFIYIDDVESGEMGYALSTFEAVLTYLQHDSAGLRRASARNRRLWKAVKMANLEDLRGILEPDGSMPLEDIEFEEPVDLVAKFESLSEAETAAASSRRGSLASASITTGSTALSHVFPFQAQDAESPLVLKKKKRVSMDVRSLSESSAISFRSQTTTIGSIMSGIEGDTSIENLTQTQDPTGLSIPMMAVEANKPQSLRYLLSLTEYYPIETVLADTTSEGTTLLSAAVQLGHSEVVNLLLDFLLSNANPGTVHAYYAKADVWGRTVAHYLFDVPKLTLRIGNDLPWRQKDKIGQTPLFALFRSYDHPNYNQMVNDALTMAAKAQADGRPLRLEDHVDNKMNTLLHIVSDAQIMHRILQECDVDPNATNEKKFTPLMMASKYGRVDLVRTLFNDPRVDLHLKELRGLTAVELAKDDEVRNRIDDLILFSNPPSSPRSDPTGRVTTVVRSFFVEDATTRFILKSGAPTAPPDPESSTTSYTITTCRRSLTDFENLVKWLSIEHPASYLPNPIPGFRNPFQIHSRPSRSVLHYTQTTLDRLLKTLLTHPTFATHELLWEFFLVPEIQTEMLSERSRRKASALAESISDDFAPATREDLRDIESFVVHARDAIRGVAVGTRSVIRRGHALQNAHADFADSVALCSNTLSLLTPPTSVLLPQSHIAVFARYAAICANSASDSSPLLQYLTTLTASHLSTAAMLTSLARPSTLLHRLSTTTRDLSRSRGQLDSILGSAGASGNITSTSSLRSKKGIATSSPWTAALALLPSSEESRAKSLAETRRKVAEGEAEVAKLGKEAMWMKGVVVGELAGWTEGREGGGREAVKAFVRGCVIRERERGRALERLLRSLKEAKN